MKRLTSFVIFLTFFVSSFFIFSLPVSAACINPGDSCQLSSKFCCSPVDGKRYNCLDNGGSGRTNSLSRCKEDPSIPLEITCKCQHSLADQETKIDGNNGFTCSGTNAEGKNVTDSTFCSTQVNCVDAPGNVIIAPGIWNGQSVKGVECKVVVPETPPPPDPPCFSWGANGGCALIKSAIGDLQTQPGPFILRVFYTLMALSGGVATLLLMRSGYQLMMSRGNAEGMQKSREQFTATVVGLLFLIFSFVLFQTIVVDILRIPGFG
jgi:hypothetical protein